MLAIRMQRTGRKGHPMYRVIVQDSHRQPTSGKIVANIGSYNPHSKEVTLDKEKAATFLKNGAQPSDRVVKLLQAEKVSLPSWVKVTSAKKQKTIKNTEKLRRNRPAEEKAPEAPAAEVATEESVSTDAEVIETPVEANEPAADTVETEPEEAVAVPEESTEPETPVDAVASEEEAPAEPKAE